ncbi:LysM peptidoglycan-binding domain-containing protein [Deinococcus sp. Arct2-2]|uniref:LysM peptidoglycan-binding domain-containing protein n=1 Tax=Deinococcus sp. Arct2-2 TaxID=2568653 RepID=UPI0010A2F16F|nr:LysM peptidoglycan-binding domain-containing protein [Deinococcus sp. Arct2-2]THF67834.1 LysM peptidoglycan-binding domain-containing protein [Deinococcus sp. Arct2-2]
MRRRSLWAGAVWAAFWTASASAAPYTVKPGDTLYSLARSVGLTVAQLQTLNSLTGPGLKVGQVLEVPTVGGPLASPSPLSIPPVPVSPSPDALNLEPVAGRVSRAGCCAHPVWTADSTHLLFLDRPAGREVGMYSVPADGTGLSGLWRLPPTLLSEGSLYGLQPAGPATALALHFGASSAGVVVTVPTSGRDAVWSPEGRLAWPTYGAADRSDWTPLTVLTADPFGSEAKAPSRPLVTVYGGRLVGWLNEDTLLLTGRLARNDARRSVLTVDRATGRTRVLAQGQLLSGVRPSPDGTQVLFRVTLDAAGRGGLFVVPTAGGAVWPVPTFGSGRWQDNARLLLVPYEPGQASHRLLRIDVTTGQTEDLLSFSDKIAGDDWQVAPDGTRLVYLSAGDRALHVLTLPDEGMLP